MIKSPIAQCAALALMAALTLSACGKKEETATTPADTSTSRPSSWAVRWSPGTRRPRRSLPRE